ncbi:hypothetical protein KXW60_007426 [Aspergillus fumigatus]|nr:hypothetical protein KXW60_007426 [Aspergillus fumigatus]KAH3275382.1 hypothetical protein KXW55_007010 [Aspergillus fumigatus]
MPQGLLHWSQLSKWSVHGRGCESEDDDCEAKEAEVCTETVYSSIITPASTYTTETLPDVRPLLLAALRFQPPPRRLTKIQSLLGNRGRWQFIVFHRSHIFFDLRYYSHTLNLEHSQFLSNIRL